MSARKERPDSANLHEALEDWQQRRAPKDIVAHTTPGDAPPIPTGPQPYTSTEFDETGVTRTEGVAWIAPAFNPTAGKDPH